MLIENLAKGSRDGSSPDLFSVMNPLKNLVKRVHIFPGKIHR